MGRSVSATGKDHDIVSDLTALERGLLPAYLLPFIRHHDVIPYPLVKSNRGRKKQYSTAGFDCSHLDCDYCGITDDTKHALVHYGHHGTQEAIPDLSAKPADARSLLAS